MIKTKTLFAMAAALALSCMTLNAQTLAAAQTLTYSIPASEPYGYTYWNGTAHGTPTTPPNAPMLWPNVKSGTIHNLVASDGTGTCYYWQIGFALNLGTCQTLYRGGGSGEGSALYCGATKWQPTTPNPDGTTHDEGDCIASFEGTAITVINGVDTPIQTLFHMHWEINHHSVTITGSCGRGHSPCPYPAQQIDSGFIEFTPETTP